MHLAILWHFHQPIYRRPGSRDYVLPWVNFHATKNYHQMARLVEETGFPTTFNFVPCLVEQIEDYARGLANDPFPARARASSGQARADRSRAPSQIRPRREQAVAPPGEGPGLILLPGRSASHRARGDAGPQARDPGRPSPALAAALRRRPDRADRDAPTIIPSCPCSSTPTRRAPRAAGAGFPPSRGRPDAHRPRPRFLPSGIRPASGRDVAVRGRNQRRVARAAAAAGSASSSRTRTSCGEASAGPASPATFTAPIDGGTTVFFRDRVLSDLIGFTYQHWDADEAVADLLRRLEDRRAYAGEKDIVVLTLDGENPWADYPENGVPFLRALFFRARFDARDRAGILLRLSRRPSGRPGDLPSSRGPGSATSRNGRGARPRTKAGPSSPGPGPPCGPLEEILIAEGSDWFWWFGEDDTREFAFLFDAYIEAAYKRAGIAHG